MIQEQDVICVSGEPFYSGVSSSSFPWSFLGFFLLLLLIKMSVHRKYLIFFLLLSEPVIFVFSISKQCPCIRTCTWVQRHTLGPSPARCLIDSELSLCDWSDTCICNHERVGSTLQHRGLNENSAWQFPCPDRVLHHSEPSEVVQRWSPKLLASEKQEALGSGPGTQCQGFSPGDCAWIILWASWRESS